MLNQNINNLGTPPLYIKEGATDNIEYKCSSNAYMIAHTHPTGGNTAPSPSDVISLVNAYRGLPGQQGLVRSLNIQASVIFGHDGSEYMICVDDRSKLSNFCNNSLNSNFFEKNGSGFKSGSIFDSYYNNARTNLLNQGYSVNDAQSYALSYVLDYYSTGLKISKKETGKTDFKEQKTELTTTVSNTVYSPTICP